MRIKPFSALRPTRDSVQSVASVPYDTVDTAEARALADGNPNSFLHVIRPEIDLPETIDIHAPEVYSRAADNLKDLMARGILERENSACFYLYRQRMGAHEQTGLVACCHVDDYDRNLIRKHEKTRQDKEDDRTRHVLTLNANTGPVFLTYRDLAAIDALVAEGMTKPPIFDITAEDGVGHTVWRIEDTARLAEEFINVPVSYIADGHHRSAAAVRAGKTRRQDDTAHTGNEEYNWFMAVLFPANQLQILPYNRCVLDLNGLSEVEFLAAVQEQFVVIDDASPNPPAPRHVSMYLGGQWFGLSWPETVTDDPVAALDVSTLQDRLLAPVLGIDDPRTSQRIEFVGGIRGTSELETRVNSGRAAVAFAMYPVTVDQMMAIADANRIMPPKSTWFEPKLRSGLLIHTLD